MWVFWFKDVTQVAVAVTGLGDVHRLINIRL